MESKNIKIVDEHGIDRVANIICSIDVDGSDYVIYWIERDNDNDNLFVSKLLKNNDGTSTMMNIEDSIEKGNLSDIVKELVTHCINDEKDNIDTDVVVLKNGKNIKIANVLFNKEQNINVQKTYITTVKKSVVTVSEKYYHIEKKQEVMEPVSEEKSVVEVNPVEMPSLDEVKESVSVPEDVMPKPPVVEVPVQEEAVPELNNVPLTENKEIPVVNPAVEVTEVPTQTVQEVTVPSTEPVAENIVTETPVVPVVDEIPNIDARVNIIGANSTPQVEQQASPFIEQSMQKVNIIPQEEQPTLQAVEQQKQETNVMPLVDSVVETQIPVVNDAPQIQEAPVLDANVPTQETVANANNVPSELFFDGSKETNLAGVFNGENDDTKPIVATETVAPIREFGQDEPVIPIVNDVAPVVQEQPKTLTRSPGFANNKFFMVIALTFFIASCVFLGYEVYKYFQLR